MSRTIQLTGDLDARVETHLSQHGGGELSEYVNKAVKTQLFWDTVDAVRARNADADPDVIEAEIQEALDAVRADRS